MPGARGVPDELWQRVWKDLLDQGWRQEAGPTPGQFYYMPAGVIRGKGTGAKARRDFFDSKAQVMRHVEALGYAQEQDDADGDVGVGGGAGSECQSMCSWHGQL